MEQHLEHNLQNREKRLQKLPELSLAHSTVPDIVFMAVLPRLPTQRAKPVSSSKE